MKNIAIVDDDEIFVFLTRKVIERSNVVELIKTFNNGLEALKYFTENASNPEALPEIILLDLSMPIMDGWQFLDEYVKLHIKTEKPIIIYICSSSISPDDIERAKTISIVSDYLIKPVTKEKLVEIIEKLGTNINNKTDYSALS
nr:response regulator [uncultured Flavobacterium sp.]